MSKSIPENTRLQLATNENYLLQRIVPKNRNNQQLRYNKYIADITNLLLNTKQINKSDFYTALINISSQKDEFFDYLIRNNHSQYEMAGFQILTGFIIYHIAIVKENDALFDCALNYFNNALLYSNNNPFALVGKALIYGHKQELSHFPELIKAIESNKNINLHDENTAVKLYKHYFNKLNRKDLCHAKINLQLYELKEQFDNAFSNFKPPAPDDLFDDIRKTQLDELSNIYDHLLTSLKNLQKYTEEDRQLLFRLEKEIAPVIEQYQQQAKMDEQIDNLKKNHPARWEYFQYLRTLLNVSFLGSSAVAGGAKLAEGCASAVIEIAKTILDLGCIPSVPILGGFVMGTLEVTNCIAQTVHNKKVVDLAIGFGANMGADTTEFSALFKLIAFELVQNPTIQARVDTLSTQTFNYHSFNYWSNIFKSPISYDGLNTEVQQAAGKDAAKMILTMSQLIDAQVNQMELKNALINTVLNPFIIEDKKRLAESILQLSHQNSNFANLKMSSHGEKKYKIIKEELINQLPPTLKDCSKIVTELVESLAACYRASHSPYLWKDKKVSINVSEALAVIEKQLSNATALTSSALTVSNFSLRNVKVV